MDNPASDVAAASIATFVPKDRALSPTEIRLAFHQLDSIATYPTIRLALRMVLLTLVRKSELIEATWSEIDDDAPSICTLDRAHEDARTVFRKYGARKPN